MSFKIISEIVNIEVIARNKSIKILPRLNRLYGKANWRKLKGFAKVQLRNSRIIFAELHWYEAHGKGKFEIKIKTIIK